MQYLQSSIIAIIQLYKMIQSPILESQKENIEVDQNFKKLNEQIKNIAKMLGGQCTNQENRACDYTFSVFNEAISKTSQFHFLIKTFLKNSFFTVQVMLNFKEHWEKATNFGLKKILNSINLYNMENQFTYQLHESNKSINVKIFNPVCLTTIQLQLLFDKAIKTVLQLIHPIINPSQSKLKQYKKRLQFFADMLQISRRRQEKSSKLPNIKKLTFSNIKQAPLKNQNSDQLQKFSEILKKSKERISKKFKTQSRILRNIKFVSSEKDSQWKNQPGSFSLVQKIHLTYKISEESSMNSQTNDEMEKAKKMNQLSSSEIQNTKNPPEQILKTSWLVKKQPNKEGISSFQIEKRVLTFLRGQKCHSFNSYYIIETDKIENLYSDFHKDRFDKVFTRSKNFFRAFQSLCQGLVFLRFNALSHRDLKPGNILISKQSIAKIIDFGSASHNKFYSIDTPKPKQGRRINNYNLATTQRYNLILKNASQSVRGSFQTNQYNFHPFFDVYAFGILLHESINNQLVRFQVGQCICQSLQYLADLCMQQNPSDRPDPVNFYVFLEQIIKIFKLSQ